MFSAILGFLATWAWPAISAAAVSLLGLGVKELRKRGAREIVEQAARVAVREVEAKLRKRYGDRKLTDEECDTLCHTAKKYVYDLLGKGAVYKYAGKVGIQRSQVDFWVGGLVEEALARLKKL